MKSVFYIFFSVLLISLLYAVVRYNLFGDVPWEHIPLYILNKVFAISGFVILMISSWISASKNINSSWRLVLFERRDILGFGSLVLIIIHVFISLAILKPEYFEKFFDTNDKLNVVGELSMLFGILGLAMMWMVNRYFSLGDMAIQQSKIRHHFKILINLAIIAGFLHTLIMGIKSWLKPIEWYGYLPPITLLAAIGFLIWLFTVPLKKTLKAH